MAPPPSNPRRHCTHQVYFVFLLLSLATLTTATPSSYSSHCSSLPPAADRHTDASDNDANHLLSSIHLPNGFISGAGADTLFSPDSGIFNDRSFSLIPTAVSRTADPALIHLTATLTLFGYRVDTYEYDGRTERNSRPRPHSIFFHLDGYYSSASAELCMVGAGTEHAAVAGSVKHYADAALRLRVPSPPTLTDPFIAGRLVGAGFDAVSLVTYAEGDAYKYSGRASCPVTMAPAGRALQPQNGSSFSCSALGARLINKYKLEYASSTTSSSLPWLREPRMNVNQVRCAANGAVRVYAVFSNDTSLQWAPRDRFSVEEQAVVADGFWDAAMHRICLTACRVVRSASGSGPSATEKNLEVRECGIGMSFWFPAVWTVHDRSVAAGMLWNASQQAASANSTSHGGAISSSLVTASSFTKIIHGNLSDVTYEYNHTMLETAKQHYLKAGLMRNGKKSKQASFPSNHTYSYRDFEFCFFLDGETGSGRAYPVSIGSAVVDGDKLAAEPSFAQLAAPELERRSRLVHVSYFILTSFAPVNTDWHNLSAQVRLELRKSRAEGVYDARTGFLSMVVCEERNGSTDCQILMTVQFTSFDGPQGFGHGKGRISSLRDRTDELYFEAKDMTLFGMYSGQASKTLWRMDLESIVTVASATLSCAFAALQILHTKRNRDAAPATSVTMLVVMALGYATPLVVNLDALLANRSKQFVKLSSNGGMLELNELVLRAPAVIAFVLQLRLLQLAWSAGRKNMAAERSTLRVCLLLYLVGGAVAGIVHLKSSRAARESLVVRLGAPPVTLWQDLASYAGLVLDGFLLPQVVLNALSGYGAAKAISPWFYAGVTAIRVAPHLYDAARARSYVPSLKSSYVYAGPGDGLFGVAWDVVVPCGAGALALLLFLQQRRGGDFSLRSRSRPGGSYQMISNLRG